MDPTRILGLPKWATRQQNYAIEARVSASDADAFSKFKNVQKSAIMQQVFAERFGMKAHMETRAARVRSGARQRCSEAENARSR